VGTNNARHQNVDEILSSHQFRKRVIQGRELVILKSSQKKNRTWNGPIHQFMAIQSKTRTNHPQHSQYDTSGRLNGH
jgi:hypothetical protein